jgi:hypothetical protein
MNFDFIITWILFLRNQRKVLYFMSTIVMERASSTVINCFCSWAVLLLLVVRGLLYDEANMSMALILFINCCNLSCHFNWKYIAVYVYLLVFFFDKCLLTSYIMFYGFMVLTMSWAGGILTVLDSIDWLFLFFHLLPKRVMMVMSMYNL